MEVEGNVDKAEEEEDRIFFQYSFDSKRKRS
jgi:hypothetical protein